MSPLYNSQAVSNSPLHCLFPGDTLALFNAEKPATGQSSVAVAIAPKEGRGGLALAFEFIFPAAPGAFNYQIQGADTDTNGSYFTEGSGTVNAVTAESDGTFRARVELHPWQAKFARVAIAQQNANGVAVTINVTAL